MARLLAHININRLSWTVTLYYNFNGLMRIVQAWNSNILVKKMTLMQVCVVFKTNCQFIIFYWNSPIITSSDPLQTHQLETWLLRDSIHVSKVTKRKDKKDAGNENINNTRVEAKTMILTNLSWFLNISVYDIPIKRTLLSW